MESGASLEHINKILDMFYGKKEDVILLIQQERWKEASRFGDHVCYSAIINNEDFIWEQLAPCSLTPDLEWNSCSWGSVAMAIYYGQKFSDRHDDIEKLKKVIKELSAKALSS